MTKLARRKGLAGFMTADEMRQRVAELTGYNHQGFYAFADALGRFDPISGARTNDRPTLITVLILRRISSEIADAVVDRERFLDDGERLVFRGIDLDQAPDEAQTDALAAELFKSWLGYELLPHEAVLFREARQNGGYKAILELMLQNAALFYY